VKITTDSHTHNLSSDILSFITETFASRSSFFIETVTLPGELGELPCDLHDWVNEDEVFYAKREGRKGLSRLCARPPRMTRELTVIAGDHNGDFTLYTAFGGPSAPREPWDPSLDEAGALASRQFWGTHALSAPAGTRLPVDEVEKLAWAEAHRYCVDPKECSFRGFAPTVDVMLEGAMVYHPGLPEGFSICLTDYAGQEDEGGPDLYDGYYLVDCRPTAA
jgi:hypothetical protein